MVWWSITGQMALLWLIKCSLRKNIFFSSLFKQQNTNSTWCLRKTFLLFTPNIQSKEDFCRFFFFFSILHLRHSHFTFKDTSIVKIVIPLYFGLLQEVPSGHLYPYQSVGNTITETTFLNYIVTILFLCLKSCKGLQSLLTLILNSW